ncbi:MAG TPA: DNA repair protein RecN [Candidatus Faecivicinus avistercoris]|nr:DNA repair protein RecN [Candidatus Faecivicinus avistercoris]
MLLELNIENIALIESLRIEFGQGLNVLTGETGSGKSIVVDCVNLVLGGRAERDLVRTGAEKGRVQALFDVSGCAPARALAEELGADCEDGLLAVSRELSRGGRNVCRMSGAIVPLSALRRLTGMLMDIHGQHEHQSLLNPARHIDFLDAFGDAGHAARMEQVRKLHAERTQQASALKKLLSDAAEKARLIDMLTFQTGEIAEAKLKPGEEERLTAKLRVLENAEKIHEGVDRAYALTYRGGSRAASAQELLQRAAEAMEGIAGIDPRYEALSGRLRELYYSVQDVGYELQDILDHLTFDPAKIDKISERLDQIDRLERKYGPSLEDVIAFGERAGARLEELRASDERVEERRAALKRVDAELKTACEALTQSRRALADGLSRAVMEQLGDLGMAKTRFEIRIEPEAKPGAMGADRVEFLISPNPGEPLKPMSAIASGGELSRIMLALKAISMDAGGVDSMVFDEIDTGVSGRMAQVVGEKMCRIARSHQVLCVTHLPQIAALGDVHFVVEKRTDGERTQTSVHRLDDEGRVRELSRLVGGAEDSESSLRHARHMLSDAAGVRQRLRSE